ncbi:MAG: chromosomal replication initiator protein DnaA [Bacilli bacterium]|nr:chromosomal replication initiator protein DnaA [Bacilli bacterium]
MDVIKIWNDFLDILSTRISSISFSTWFKESTLHSLKDGIAKITVPYEPSKIHITENYYDLVEEILLYITGKQYEIEVYLPSEVTSEDNSVEEITNKISENTIEDYKYYSNFNQKYRFDNFVVGDSNRFAYSSALAVAERPGKLYNPLFIYGKSGLGKTHLMHAIGNFLLENSDKKVLYITSEQFINDFININKKEDKSKDNVSYIDVFKRKYRDVDVLMIDDIQFLGPATKSQQEFTNTFNTLYDNEKQIIICSDRSVDDLKLLEDRLKTRFNWGLKVDINPPNFDLKVQIIKNKIEVGDLAIDLSDDIINFIASNCGNDVRNLEGAITRLVAYSAIMNIKSLTINDAMDALSDYTNNLIYSQNTITKIQNIVANYFKLHPDDLKSKKRSKPIANARQIAMYLCRTMTEETQQRIGLEFGGRDHSTVIHSYEKVNNDIINNKELDKIITELKQLICE